MQIGPYEIVRPLGKGGMGSVSVARDPAIDRLVAIKLLRDGIDSPEIRERFKREARSAGKLRHPNIVTIFHVGEYESRPFIVMEYIPGNTLAEIIKQQAPLTIGRKIRIMEELCRGLAYAHKAGIVHRDVKPLNILVDTEGSVKILDFGIARIGEQGLTQLGMMMGTPSYMAPEQISPGVADHRSDVFAVGLVFYELLTYRRAFPREDFSVLHQILHEEPLPVETLCPDIDPDVVKVLQRALLKKPDERYQDLGAMRQDLARIWARVHTPEDEITSEDTPTTPIPTPISTVRKDTPPLVHTPAPQSGAQAQDNDETVLYLEPPTAAEPQRQTEEAERVEQARLAEEKRKADEADARAEQLRVAEEKRKADDKRRAEEAARLEQARLAEEKRKADQTARTERARELEHGRAQAVAGGELSDATILIPRPIPPTAKAPASEPARPAETKPAAKGTESKARRPASTPPLAEQTPAAPEPAPAAKASAPASATAAQASTASSQKQTPSWLIPAAAAALLLVGGGGWYLSRGGSSTNTLPAASTTTTTATGASQSSGGTSSAPAVQSASPGPAPTTPASPPPVIPAPGAPPPPGTNARANAGDLRKRAQDALGRNDIEGALRALQADPSAQNDPAVVSGLDDVVAAARRIAARSFDEAQRAGAAQNATDDYRSALARRQDAESLSRNGRKPDSARAFVNASELFARAASARPAADTSAAAQTSRPTPTPTSPLAVPTPPAGTPAPTPAQASTATLTPAPAPPPEPSAPARSAATDTAEIQNVLQQYAAGYQSMDVGAIRRVWPGAPSSLNFNNVKSYSLSIVSPQISLQSDTATVTAVRQIRAQLEAGRRQDASPKTVFTLRRSGGGWVIDKVQ